MLLALLLSLSAAQAAPESPSSYTDIDSVGALRRMKRIASRDPATLSEAEGLEWARARFAWIALLRLEGKEAEAAKVFGGCGRYCGKWGASEEWGALKRWGCGKRRKTEPCREQKP